jgi:hypothetical protein
LIRLFEDFTFFRPQLRDRCRRRRRHDLSQRNAPHTLRLITKSTPISRAAFTQERHNKPIIHHLLDSPGQMYGNEAAAATQKAQKDP